MIIELWIALLALSLLIIFLGYYVQNYRTEPNYILIFIGFSFMFLLSVTLMTSSIQVKNGFEEQDIVGGNTTDMVRTYTRADYGDQDIGLILAAVCVFMAFLQYYHYKTPDEIGGTI